MSAAELARKTREPQRGYALLLVLFVMTLMLLAAMAASPVLYTQIQREKEQETIWRGKQYARAVKLFYRKNGRFPSSLEDLYKPKLNVRFLRQPYTDPLNAKDGSWRIIYVGPGGQLIGSRKRNRGSLQMPAAGGITPPGTPPAQPPSKDVKDSTGQTGDSSGTSDNQGPVFGGSIIGVGSKVNKPSIIVYEDGRKYIDWEFIWDPSKDAIAVGQPGMQIGMPAGQPPASGAPQFGNPPGGSPPSIPPLSNPPLE
jgi:type II secretory pathway pseudopilin PulG